MGAMWLVVVRHAGLPCPWVPAFAGMTERGAFADRTSSPRRRVLSQMTIWRVATEFTFPSCRT